MHLSCVCYNKAYLLLLLLAPYPWSSSKATNTETSTVLCTHVTRRRTWCISLCCMAVDCRTSVHTNIILITTKLYLPWRFDLYQRPSSEKAVQFFFRFLWRGKKSVVCVAQCIAALVPVHRTPSLLSDVHCFLNPSATYRGKNRKKKRRTSSDEGLWWRLKRQCKQSLVVINIMSVQTFYQCKEYV